MKPEIRVAVSNLAPLVMDKDGQLSGFEIDLWEKIAQDNNFDFQYEAHHRNFLEVIDLLAKKKIDVGLAGLTINEQREKIIDFSHSDLDSGLLILVNKKNNKVRIWESIKIFFTEGRKLIAQSLILVTAFVVIFGNLLWLAERSANTFSKNYFPGIFESFWLVVCSMSTDSFGDYVPHTWLGRIIILGIIVGGVAIFGLLIAQVTAFIAVKKIRGEINNYHDLANKRVATRKGTTSADILQKIGAKVISTPTIAEAYDLLEKQQVDAVVFDAPELIFFVKNNSDQFETVGEIFDKQRYGIALQTGSPLKESINLSLLKIRESGEYDALYKKWFGDGDLME